MYSFLKRYLPPVAADAVMIAWYTLLIALVVYFSFEPKAEFNYLAL